ncbi:MAG: hypothetical protein R3B37_08985 [Nitrospira sp.]|nr:hypothetical protein [Nitrospira sp.]
MSFLLIRSIRHLTTVFMLTLCVQSVTSSMASEGNEYFMQRMPVSEAVLDHMRGGFQRSLNDPILSFGIERTTYLNGQLVSSTVLNIPDLMQLEGNSSRPFTLVQTGSGNAVTTGAAALPALMTVLQNSLDNQNIQNQTVINATAGALGWARSLALGNALSQATIATIRH